MKDCFAHFVRVWNTFGKAADRRFGKNGELKAGCFQAMSKSDEYSCTFWWAACDRGSRLHY